MHEFGYTGSVSVRAHRAARPRDPFGRKYDRRAHSRRMSMPERAPLRTEIGESGPTYRRVLRRKIAAVFATGNRGGSAT